MKVKFPSVWIIFVLEVMDLQKSGGDLILDPCSA